MPEKAFEIAYDAAKLTLSQQDGTISNVRNRATTLFTAASLAVTFTAGVGLISSAEKSARHYPEWAAFALLAVLSLMASAVMVVHWPVKSFHYGPSATVILRLHEESKDEDAIRLAVTQAMIAGGIENRRGIKRLQSALRMIVGLLWIEILIILIAIVTT
ncbi:hypothetical protein EV138_3422 [Kribbella voronezhensis]|uniref:Uncharacterized protein n=1 Tax=Kribbella voronezhensis TaxID=2512212 RepID=A0A4R7TCS6_9ACTN|nr:hypothetical protein [Kribbella voronezhensis]TDU89845.1 hypothetical protein EV138_3422 [Kribbella voronezhensis]